MALGLARFAGFIPVFRDMVRSYFKAPEKPVQVFGLSFKNPLGLAAGYDKDGLGIRGLALLGFGHLELGTVTLHPQPGNPRPRLFRLTEEQALINRMGFPSRGAKYLANRLARSRPKGVVIGVNLGKNKETPMDEAANDYQQLLKIFAPLADYLAINISSPNTTGLRQLQAKQALGDLLSVLHQERIEQEARLKRRIPLLVKLAPDLGSGELEDAVETILFNQMDGVIATNTTTRRAGLASPWINESGGLSGLPLRPFSLAMVRQIFRLTHGELPVVGAGGVMRPADVKEFLDAGAVLVQIYTGLVYQGPGLPCEILRSL